MLTFIVTADVVAHDVEFGFKRMSYLEFGRIDFATLNTLTMEETEWQDQCVSDEYFHDVSIRPEHQH